MVVLAVVCLLAGLAVGVRLSRPSAHRAGNASPDAPAPAAVAPLSPATQAALAGLPGAVEIRFHARLPESRVAEPWREFARRVEAMLTEFERAASGRVRVSRVAAANDADARATAAADGVEVFALGRDEHGICGVRVLGAADKVTLARLVPEWEAALEFDLARAVTRAAGAAGGVAVSAGIAAGAVAELQQALPDWESLSAAEAEEKLRAAALAEFKTAAQAMSAQVAEAQQRLAGAQASGNATQIATAQAALQKLQAEQAESLGAIARRMEAQVNALRQLKPAAP